MDSETCSMHGVLNRLVSDPKTFDILLDKLILCIIDKVETEGKEAAMNQFVSLIHSKAIVESKLTAVYVDCLQEAIRLLRKALPNSQLSSKLISKCMTFFEDHLVLNTEDEYEMVDLKRKKLGNIRFLAELFCGCVVGPEEANHIIESLQSGAGDSEFPSDDNVEGLRIFIKLTSTYLDDDVEQRALTRIAHLKETHPSKRVRILLLDFCGSTDTETVQTSTSTPTSYPPSSPSDLSFCSPPTLDLPPSSTNIIQKAETAQTKKAFEKEQAERKECTVYVVGIDTSIPESELLAYAQQCGPVSKIRFCGDTKNPTVYGFFEFEYPEAARAMIRRDQTPLGDYIIQCSPARSAIRDLHGDANTDANIRTLCFGKSSQPPPPPTSSPTLKESTLNSSWNKERRRAQRDASIQKRHLKQQYYDQWHPQHSSVQASSLAEAVVIMATEKVIPQGMPQRLHGLGPKIVVSTLIGQDEWESVLAYLPDFLIAAEELYRTDCLPMLINGVQELIFQFPNLRSSVYERLSELLILCRRKRVINTKGMALAIAPLEKMDGYFEFSFNVASELKEFSVIAQVF